MPRKLEPDNIHDWALRAAERIDDEYPMRRLDSRARPTVARVAAIIATFAEPILRLLAEAAARARWQM